MADEIHTVVVVQALEMLGERLHDGAGAYVGVTPGRLAALLTELSMRREVAISQEASIGALRRWMEEYAPGRDHTDPITSALELLQICRETAVVVTQHVRRVAPAITSALFAAGLKLPG